MPVVLWITAISGGFAFTGYIVGVFSQRWGVVGGLIGLLSVLALVTPAVLA